VKIGLVTLLALGLLAGCTSAPAPTREKKVPKIPVVAVTRPSLEKRGETRVYTGTVESLTQVAVVPQVAGQLEAVLVSVGDPVKVDQLLATVDDSQLEAQVQQAQAQASAAQSGVVSAMSDLSTGWGGKSDRLSFAAADFEAPGESLAAHPEGDQR